MASVVRPIARRDDLLVSELESGEIVVFDRKANRAHSLNPAAAIVWRGCDGQRSVTDLAALLADARGTEASEDLVWMSVNELRKLRLLEDFPSDVVPANVLTRRQALARFGSSAAAAAAMVPVVASVLAPKSAAATSCVQPGGGCSVGSQCCSGVCAGTICA